MDYPMNLFAHAIAERRSAAKVIMSVRRGLHSHQIACRSLADRLQAGAAVVDLLGNHE